MIYGMYLSAQGVLANAHRQDVIANNLANSETVGFKKDLAIFREQRTEARLRGTGAARSSNPMLEELGGGVKVMPTRMDLSQGELETTGGPLDLAIQGDGFFALRDRGQLMLTRDGRFTVGRNGHLASAISGLEVLDGKKQPIAVKPGVPLSIAQDGTVTQGKEMVGRIGVFDVPARTQLRKRGASLLTYNGAERSLKVGNSTLRVGSAERSNVEPTEELARLMDAQRLLEANVNMIRCQDVTLGRLVNDVGRIG